jgi:hypothetical protein
MGCIYGRDRKGANSAVFRVELETGICRLET